jgi:hypothetical protein
MIRVETSQGEVIIDVDEKYSRVGIKISGGADSAIMAYMLALYKKNVRDVDLIPITVINAIKPHQHIFAHRVVKFIEEELGVKFEEHRIKPEPVDPSKYGEEQSVYVRGLRREGIIDTHFTGITENPDVELDETMEWTGDPTRGKELGYKPVSNMNSYVPFANINKKAIAELYRHYDLMDSLFPVTRSCENKKVHFTEPHCGDRCWWCLERKWGFGRVD